MGPKATFDSQVCSYRFDAGQAFTFTSIWLSTSYAFEMIKSTFWRYIQCTYVCYDAILTSNQSIG
jgi:hypothetical protein